MAYQPPLSFTTFNSSNKPKKIDEDLLDLGYSGSSTNSKVVKKNDTVSNRKKGTAGSSLFNPDDILNTFGNESGRQSNRRSIDFEDDYN